MVLQWLNLQNSPNCTFGQKLSLFHFNLGMGQWVDKDQQFRVPALAPTMSMRTSHRSQFPLLKKKMFSTPLEHGKHLNMVTFAIWFHGSFLSCRVLGGGTRLAAGLIIRGADRTGALVVSFCKNNDSNRHT